VSRKRRRNGQPVDDIRDRIRKASLEMKSDEKLCWREIKSGEKLDLVVICGGRFWGTDILPAEVVIFPGANLIWNAHMCATPKFLQDASRPTTTNSFP